MQTYVALLRGVNVGGKICKMELVRSVFEHLGFSAVKTYVQSGNVVFTTAQGSPLRLTQTIEERLAHKFGFPIRVLVKTSKELADVVRRNPFVKDKTIDQSKLHVTFLSEAAKQTAAFSLQGLAINGEQFLVLGQQIYLYCPNGYGRTKLSNNAIEKKLSLVATTRNWRTVNTLLGMMQLDP